MRTFQGPSGGSIQAPTSATAGTTIVINVSGATHVAVGFADTGIVETVPVHRSGRTEITIPAGSAGRVLLVTTLGPPPCGSASINVTAP